jgi:hypothetical protein
MLVILKLMDKYHQKTYILSFSIATPCKRYTTFLLTVSYNAKQTYIPCDLNRPLHLLSTYLQYSLYNFLLNPGLWMRNKRAINTV